MPFFVVKSKIVYILTMGLVSGIRRNNDGLNINSSDV